MEYTGEVPQLSKLSDRREIKGHLRRFINLEKLVNRSFGEAERNHLLKKDPNGESAFFDIGVELRRRLNELKSLPNARVYPVPDVALSTRVLCDVF